MSSSAAPTLSEICERRLRARGYSADAAQLTAINCLEDLRGRVATRGRFEAHPFAARLLRRLSGRAPRPESGIYLWGPVGRGKTWLMDLFFQSLPFPERRRRHFHRFMHDVHAELKTLRDRDAPLEIIAARLARQTRILCFDELFVADIADAMILAGLFGGLFRRGVTLVATSNVPPRELYRNGLQHQRFLPAIDLIERHTKVVAVDGERDYRLRQLTQAGTYIAAAAPQGVIEGSRADASFLAGLLRGKFDYHQPLYRQHRRLIDCGIDVSRPWLTYMDAPTLPSDQLVLADR